jgi:hypothetical protein
MAHQPDVRRKNLALTFFAASQKKRDLGVVLEQPLPHPEGDHAQ